MISNEVNKWIEKEGIQFLKDIGIKKDQFVLDFGCGHGNYTILASLVVGNKGRIYAVDKNQESLNKLIYKIKEKKLNNIEIIKLVNQLKLPLPKESVDMVLLFDVLHLVEPREYLLTEIIRILKPTGILSIYPKHHQTHMNMSLEDVIKEIQSVGFCFNVKNFKNLIHDNTLEKGVILNFKKV
jgi:ubiquinone/menaquinone biosynthesis C-methylase UbiE